MRNLVENILFRTIAVSLLAAFPLLVYSQNPYPKPYTSAYAPAEMHGNDTSEKSIAVDKNVNLKLCVTQGNLKINGWNRSEIRVFVKDGAKFSFQTLEKSKQTGSPVWVMLMGLSSTKGKYPAPTECIWGDEIEIDVPANATLNITGQETKTVIDTVRKASVKIIGGDINLRNVAEGITATIYEGDLTVEESMGSMILETTTGNILVFDAGPSQIGDIFKAKTNGGNVSLQRLDYRQVDVGSISGSVSYTGEILSGGSYNLSTSNGSIKMFIPPTSSCQVVASYGFGTFNPELPFKVETENIMEGLAKRTVGKIGNGGATVKLTTNSGSIAIKKQ